MATARRSHHRRQHSALAPFGALARWAASLWSTRRRRARLRALLEMEPRLLDDMGLNRDEIWWALSLPYEVNAAQELHRVARRRRARPS